MRYFVECTHTYQTELNTGIQRVVRNIVNHALQAAGRRRKIFPVVFADQAFHRVDEAIAHPQASEVIAVEAPATPPAVRQNPLKSYLRNVIAASRQLLAALIPYPPFIRFIYAPRSQWGLSRIFLAPLLIVRWWRQPAPVEAAQPLTFGKDDVLVLLDSSWHLDIWPTVLRAKEQGATVVCVTYDLIPQSHPQFCDEYLVTVFDRWMTLAARHADAFVCISRTVALGLRQSIARMAPERAVAPRISYFWLGSELDGHRAETDIAPREELRLACSGIQPAYVYVSTVEPRKNHRYALDAFEILWQRGVAANFIIVGRVGWRCDELIDRIRSHRELGRRLFMFNDLGDGELGYCYDRARGLIFTSITEGFGLPIVEALQRSLPVFASDIAVFREIGGTGVEFVGLEDPAALADALERHIAAGARRLAAPVPWMSWNDCAVQLFERIDNCLAAKPDSALLIP